MIYEVVEVAVPRFEFERDEPFKNDDVLSRLTIIYKVLRVLPGNGYDGVIEVDRVMGPAQTGRG